MGGFYLMLKSGVDVVAIMEACYVPEKILGQILIISSLFFLYLPVYPSRHKIVHLKKKSLILKEIIQYAWTPWKIIPFIFQINSEIRRWDTMPWPTPVIKLQRLQGTRAVFCANYNFQIMLVVLNPVTMPWPTPVMKLQGLWGTLGVTNFGH